MVYTAAFIASTTFNSGVDLTGMDGALDGNMKTQSNQSHLLDLCHSRVKKYAEKRHVIAHEVQTNPEFLTAGVLVPIFIREGSLYTLLTLRSEHLPTHKGEVAFPGGKKEDDDEDIVATALREAHEEVGLSPEIVQVVAVLSPLTSRARARPMYVYPVIGLVKSQFDLVINNSEVQTTFEVPLEFFLSKETHKRDKMNFKGKTFEFHFFLYDTGVGEGESQKENSTFHIWGLTASICLRVAMVALSKLPEFDLEEHYTELMQYITEINGNDDDDELRPLSRM